MYRVLLKKVQLLLVVALVLAPLQVVFASGTVSFKHPIACHTDKQMHAEHHGQMDAAQMKMMVDCEHFTGMQHGTDSSCQAADAQNGAEAFTFSDVLVPAPDKILFRYDRFMVGGTVPLLSKPPRLST